MGIYSLRYKNKICHECKQEYKFCWCDRFFDDADYVHEHLDDFTFAGYDFSWLIKLNEEKEYLEILRNNRSPDVRDECDANIKDVECSLEECKKFLRKEYDQFYCVRCGYIHYEKPGEEVAYFCTVCGKYNYLIHTRGLCYSYYDKDGISKMIESFQCTFENRLNLNLY